MNRKKLGVEKGGGKGSRGLNVLFPFACLTLPLVLQSKETSVIRELFLSFQCYKRNFA